MAHCSCSGAFDKNRTLSRTLTIDIVGGQATTDNVGTNRSLLWFNCMMSCLSCCGESVLQILMQNKAILSWCGDSGTTTLQAIVGGVISMLQMVDYHDINVICI